MNIIFQYIFGTMSTAKDFEFKYNGENTIDLNTLLTSQFHFLATLNEIQKEMYPNAKINLRVAGFKPGSFVINMVLETSFIADLVTPENTKILTEILTGFGGLLVLYKKLKGKKALSAKDNDNGTVDIKIEGNNNHVTVDKRVFNIYKNNITASESIKKNFELLDEDNSVSGIEIIDPKKKKPIVKVDRKDFESLTAANEYLNKDLIEHLQVDDVLFIKKANLFPEKGKVWKWSFIHKGRDIDAKITDVNFMNEINDGLKLGQGDRLVVDILIQQKFNEKVNTYVETGRYNVIKVHKVEGRKEQFKMSWK